MEDSLNIEQRAYRQLLAILGAWNTGTEGGARTFLFRDPRNVQAVSHYDTPAAAIRVKGARQLQARNSARTGNALREALREANGPQRPGRHPTRSPMANLADLVASVVPSKPLLSRAKERLFAVSPSNPFLGWDSVTYNHSVGKNYAMQLLAAPTREELDKAHASRKTLDVGIQSSRNLLRTKGSRRMAWIAIALTSTPIHLIANSGFHSTITTTDYSWLLADEDFVYGRRAGAGTDHSTQFAYDSISPQIRSGEVFNWDNVTIPELLRRYSAKFVNRNRHVIIVTNHHTLGNNSVIAGGATDIILGYQSDWLCMFSDEILCRPEKIDLSRRTWTAAMRGEEPVGVAYGLIEKIEMPCRLCYSRTILIAVCICNLIKALVLSWALTCYSQHPLVTVGDAIASYLRNPDAGARACTLGFRQYRNSFIKPRMVPRRYEARSYRQWSSGSIRRWFWTNCACSAALITVGSLLAAAIGSGWGTSGAPIATLWNLGFGTVNPISLVRTGTNYGSSTTTNIGFVVLANTPQLLLSFCYLSYNSLFTLMLMESEWQSYGFERKSLRTSEPKGMQRSTYYLNLPYRWAIPLLVTSGALHWMASQSLFYVKVDLFQDSLGALEGSHIETLGFSCIAMITALILGGTAMAFALVVGLRPLKSRMPLMGGCSGVVAAACHPPGVKDGDGIAVEAEDLVKWGVVDRVGEDGAPKSWLTFSRDEVGVPIPGGLYGGA
ncbi:MAG: hypothetical protein M1840_004327 [Geoglossum simile]|nr:MAG: hypothetical protein M1840_004327 [Geoglossum simile]